MRQVHDAADDVRRVREALLGGTRLVVVSGPPGAGQRALLIDVTRSDEVGLRIGDIVDVTVDRHADGVDLLVDVAMSLRRRGYGDFSKLDRRVAKYRARTSGQATRLERGIAVGQQGLALAAGAAVETVAPPAGPLIRRSIGSPELRDLAVERFQGTGELRDVYDAAAEDFDEAAAAAAEPLVLVLEGIDDRLDDPGLRVLLDRVLPKEESKLALVVSARDPDVDLGPTLEDDRERVWLRRLTDERIRDRLRDDVRLAEADLDELVQAIDGSSERLANVLRAARR